MTDPAARLKRPPGPPASLSEGAETEWRRLAPVAQRLGTLTQADLRAFELLCETLATEKVAQLAIAAEGMATATGEGGLKPHPAVRIMETARNQAARLLDAFGLTPKGRATVERAPSAADSGWEGLAG